MSTFLNLAEVQALCGGRLHGIEAAAAQQLQLGGVERDSRQVCAGDLFLALQGERFDAHDFVPDVAGRAAAALVSRPLDVAIPQVVVDDVRLALGRLGAGWRARFNIPVIGLTGSNGKTTLKEMLTAILSQQGNTLATLGNLNNDLGVPLTLLRLRAEHEFAVIEMGANHFGEIAYLTGLTRPDVAILNNAGAAHLEGFGDIRGVSRAKGEIFQGLSDKGMAVINADDQYADYWLGLNQERQVLCFGLAQAADVTGQLTPENRFCIQLQGEQVIIDLPLLGRHNRLNALAASAGAAAVGLPLATIGKGLERLSAVKGRLMPRHGDHGGLVIDDTYNANPSSMRAAVDVLADFQGQTILIIGDMAELGSDAAEQHATMGHYIKTAGIQQCFSLGTLSAHISAAFGEPAHAFQQLDDLLATLKPMLNAGSVILVKGSRSARMERVVEALCTQPSAGFSPAQEHS